jgi:hypothetical protein
LEKANGLPNNIAKDGQTGIKETLATGVKK